ncbi:phage minor capsid protein [Streptomyces sp. NPDC002889]|uniref:phage minor capsid protein n=1 Tax=Streptomyces sp. NPDC002889 TaxID=3364669 RepID=UPI0036816653
MLALDGPGGTRTLEVEHATYDDRTVRVNVAGSLDDARRAGLQHPNCRHSTSAYLPGITRAPVEHSKDPASYEATQRQRGLERAIRKWKNRAAVATTPEAKRAVEARVRQWQGRMREHLAQHPELIRRREREQPGAGNLPPAGGYAGRPSCPRLRAMPPRRRRPWCRGGRAAARCSRRRGRGRARECRGRIGSCSAEWARIGHAQGRGDHRVPPPIGRDMKKPQVTASESWG